MKVRRLNDAGLKRMQAFLDSLTMERPEEYPPFNFEDENLTEVVTLEVHLEIQSFRTRLDAGRFFFELFEAAGSGDVSKDEGLWAWVALLHFDSLCPRSRGGRYKAGAPARWIPEVSNYQRYYRHLLAGPYVIVRAYADDPRRALAILCNPVERPGEIVEQLASRPAMVSNRGLMGAATLLYVDPKTGRPKRGAGGKGPGSPRRLASVYEQLDLTWDLYALDAEELVGMLPEEFDRYRPDRGKRKGD